MTEDAIQLIAQLIKRLNMTERSRLIKLLEDDQDGTAGVIAKLPEPPPDREDGIELELPEDYWETAQ